MKLSISDYKKILKFYKLSVPKNKKTLEKKANKIIADKFCSCIKKVQQKFREEGIAIGICTNSVINRKGYKRGKFKCKKRRTINLHKGGKRKKKTRRKRGGQPILIPTKREVAQHLTKHADGNISIKIITQKAWDIFKQTLLEQKKNWFPLINSTGQHNMKGDIIYIKIMPPIGGGPPWIYMMTRKHLLDSINKKLDYIIIIDDVKSTGKKVQRFDNNGNPYLAERYTFNKHLITPLSKEILEKRLKNNPSMLTEVDVEDILKNNRYHRFGINSSQFTLMKPNPNPNPNNYNKKLVEDRIIMMKVEHDKIVAADKAYREKERIYWEKKKKESEERYGKTSKGKKGENAVKRHVKKEGDGREKQRKKEVM